MNGSVKFPEKDSPRPSLCKCECQITYFIDIYRHTNDRTNAP